MTTQNETPNETNEEIVVKGIRSILFPEEIIEETTIAFLNQVEEALSEGMCVNIYMSTIGGMADCAVHISRSLNTYAEIYPSPIFIFTGSKVLSAGMEILRDCDLPISVSDYTFGMLHLPSADVEFRGIEDVSSLSYNMLDLLKVKQEEYITTWKEYLELTDEEVNKLTIGGDLYLSPDRMKKYFNSFIEELCEEEEKVED